MRIRTIKPEFWSNEDIATLSPESALLAIGLLNYADDEGYFNANPMLIKAAIFPLRQTKDIAKVLLPELIAIGYIEMMIDTSGKIYGRVVNFSEHQVINKPKESKIRQLAMLRYEYGTSTVGVPVGKEGNGKEGNGMNMARFEEFWKVYPRHEGKKAAQRAYERATADHETIMKGLEASKRKWDDPKFIPHAATWLNGERWQDEQAPDKSQPTADGERQAYEWHKKLLANKQFNLMPEYRLKEKIAEYEKMHFSA